MTQETDIQTTVSVNDSDAKLKQQIAHHINHQSESARFLHTWMKRFHAAGLGFILSTFIVAMYVSIAWKSVVPLVIPIAWFIFAASIAPSIILIGLDSIIVRAFPPVFLGLRPMEFVSGRSAVFIGFSLILIALIIAGFWGLFSYAVLTFNFTLIEIIANIIGVTISIGILISILQSIYRKSTS